MSQSVQPLSSLPSEEPKGVEHAGVIDLLVHEAATDEVTLVMAEGREWSGSDEQLFQLQEKINAYLSFALDGEMFDAYPNLRNKPLRLRLECIGEPDPRTAEFLSVVQQQIGFQGIALEVCVNAPPVCENCSCGGHA